MKLSILIPVYNSEKILPTLIKRILKYIKISQEQFEIILVNDCSRDLSWEIIKRLSNRNKMIKGINLKKNYGQHYAIFTGLKYTKGDYIICMDDDMQHDPIFINKIIDELKKNNDTCYVKYIGRKHSIIKIFISWLNNIVSSFLMTKSVKIYTSSFKGFKKNIKKIIIKYSSNYVFLDYPIIRFSKKISVINVNHKKRFRGQTNYKLKQLITLWSNMIFVLDTKKISLRSFFIMFLRLFFIKFLKNYIDLNKNKKIIIRSKTFK